MGAAQMVRKGDVTRRDLAELPDVLSPEEVMQALGISRTAVYTRLRTGEIPAARIGRRFFIRKFVIEQMLEGKYLG